MINIEGRVQVLPNSVSYDSGKLRVGEESLPAVIQSLISDNGVVQVIFPADKVDAVIEGLQQMKEEAEKNHSSDIYIPTSDKEIELAAQEAEKLKKVEDEVRVPE